MISDYLKLGPRQALGVIVINLHNTLVSRTKQIEALLERQRDAAGTEFDFLSASILVSAYQIAEDVGAISFAAGGPIVEALTRLDDVRPDDISDNYSKLQDSTSDMLRSVLGFREPSFDYFDGFTDSDRDVVEEIAKAALEHHRSGQPGIAELAEFHDRYRRLYNVYKHIPGKLLVYSRGDGATGVTYGLRTPKHEFESVLLDVSTRASVIEVAKYAVGLGHTVLSNLNPRTLIDDDAHRLPHAVDGQVPEASAKAYSTLVGRCPGGLVNNAYSTKIDGNHVEFRNPFGGGSGIEIHLSR